MLGNYEEKLSEISQENSSLRSSLRILQAELDEALARSENQSPGDLNRISTPAKFHLPFHLWQGNFEVIFFIFK
jgi:hypothetical protein